MSLKCLQDNGASDELINRFKALVTGGVSERDAVLQVVAGRRNELESQLNSLRKAVGVKEVQPKASRVTPASVYSDIVANRDNMEGAMKAMVSDDFNQDVLDFFIDSALDNRNESERMFGPVRGKEITDKLLTLASAAQHKAAAEEIPQTPTITKPREQSNVPEPIADFEVTEIIDYTDSDVNTFRSDQQRKFNQGKNAAVLVVGHSELMELIGIGAKVKQRIAGGSVKIDEERRKELEKKYNISASEAHSRATSLAKTYRDKTTEKIILIGKNESGSIKRTSATDVNRTVNETKTDNGLTLKYNFGRAPAENTNVAKKVNVKAVDAPKAEIPKPVVRKAPRLTVPGPEAPVSNHQEIFDLVKAAYPKELESANLTDFMNTSGFRSDDGKYYYLGNDTYMNFNQRVNIPRDLIFVPKESIENKLDELNNSCNA